MPDSEFLDRLRDILLNVSSTQLDGFVGAMDHVANRLVGALETQSAATLRMSVRLADLERQVASLRQDRGALQ